jgi:hypothetical protein
MDLLELLPRPCFDGVLLLIFADQRNSTVPA